MMPDFACTSLSRPARRSLADPSTHDVGPIVLSVYCAIIATLSLAPQLARSASAQVNGDDAARTSAQSHVAEDAADEASIDEMARLLERLDASPRDVVANFNIGLRYAHENRLGLAILHLERARSGAPLDREIQDALQKTRQEARRQRAEAHAGVTLIEGEPSRVLWWRFFRTLPKSVYAYGMLGGIWILFAALTARRRARIGPGRDVSTVIAICAALLVLASATMLGGYMRSADAVRPAIVIAESPAYRSAPDELAPRQRSPNLYPGATVLIAAERPEWVHIELADGERVWVDRRVVTAIYP